MDWSGIKGDPKTTLAGAVVILMTIGLVLKAIDLDTWLAVSGFALGGGLMVTNSHKRPTALPLDVEADAGPPEAVKRPEA